MLVEICVSNYLQDSCHALTSVKILIVVLRCYALHSLNLVASIKLKVFHFES